MTRFFAVSIALLSLFACGGTDHDAPPEPLGKLDFRPTAQFGFDAAITGLRLGKQVVDARTDDPAVRAQGYRYLLRQIEMNLDLMSGDHDPAHPSVTRCPSKSCKLGFDNPDYTYVGVSPLSAAYRYRLYGTRGNADLLLFQVLERADGPFRGTAKTDSRQLQVNGDGSWEIIIGTEKPASVAPANYLRLQEEQATLLVRIAHNDWDSTIEPAINVEVISGPPHEEPAQFTAMRMAVAGFALSKMLPNQLRRWVDRLQDAPLNGMDTPCVSWGAYCRDDGGFGNFATGGRYLLAEDEALIVEAPDIGALYQNIQLGNIWAESLDYANRQTSLNGHQAVPDSDGVYRYVLAHRDPGVANWLDVSGHPEGAMFMRWVFPPEGIVPGRPKTKQVRLENLHAHLPADTPTVTPTRRVEQMKARLRAVNRRKNPAGHVISQAIQ